MGSTSSLHQMIYASLMSALIAAGAYIIVPIGPVPISLQTLFVLLSGLLLGSKWGLISVAVYLLSGILGLPVFSGGTGGIGRIIGPTGGYLIGFLPAVYIAGKISEAFNRRVWADIAAMVLGTVIIYCFGVTWLHIMMKMTFSKALAAGMIPFLPGDLIKTVAAIPIAKAVRPILNKETPSKPVSHDRHSPSDASIP